MNAKEFFEKIHAESVVHRQYHEVMAALYHMLLREGATSVIHNLRNTAGTGTHGIDETIARLKAEGLVVERVQDRIVDVSTGIKMLMQTTVRVGFAEWEKPKCVGSITDPEIDQPLPPHLQSGLSYPKAS